MTVYEKAYVPSELSRGVREGSEVSCLIVAVKTLGLGFGVWGLGFGVWGLGFGVWGLRLWGFGFGA